MNSRLSVDGLISSKYAVLDTTIKNNIGEYPFENCGALEQIELIGFSGFNLDFFTKTLYSLNSISIDVSANYNVPDTCFSDNVYLSDFIFGPEIKYMNFYDNALSGSYLTSITLCGITGPELSSGDEIIYDISENMVKDYSSEKRLPFELYEYFYPGNMSGKQLHYGCIYDDLSSCIEFCTENCIPLVLMYSRGIVACPSETSWHMFGLNAKRQHYEYQMWKNIRNKNITHSIKNQYEKSPLAKTLMYKWISNQPYIFCMAFQRVNSETGKRMRFRAGVKNLRSVTESSSIDSRTFRSSECGLTIWTADPDSDGKIDVIESNGVSTVESIPFYNLKSEYNNIIYGLKQNSRGLEFIIDSTRQPPQGPAMINAYYKAETNEMVSKIWPTSEFRYPFKNLGGAVLINFNKKINKY